MTKQVLIIRKGLKMPKGKIVSQMAHASSAFVMREIETNGSFSEELVDDELNDWLSSGKTKVALQCSELSDLEEIEKKAVELGLRVHKVIDAGRTIFNGVPTFTTLSIGPNSSKKIDSIAGHLKLY